ncbi:MAG: hypothetical protein RLN72_12475 [Henriciella sp.]
MLRSILSVIVGIVVAGLVVLVTEIIGHLIFPPPEGTDLSDPEALAAIMDEIPLGAKIAVLVAWFLGVLAGCFAALRISRGTAWTGLAVAAVMLAMMAMTLATIPHPVWMVVGAVLVTAIGWAGAARLAR